MDNNKKKSVANGKDILKSIIKEAVSNSMFPNISSFTYHTHTLGLNGWEYILYIFITINYLKGTSNKQNSTEMESTQFIYSVQSNNIYYVRNI